MSKSQRQKGKVGERAVAELARANGFPNAKRTGDAQQVAGDIAGMPGLYVEVRRRETLNLPAWIREVETEHPPNTLPLIAFRRSQEPWYGAVPLGDLFRVLAREKALTRADRMHQEAEALIQTEQGSAEFLDHANRLAIASARYSDARAGTEKED